VGAHLELLAASSCRRGGERLTVNFLDLGRQRDRSTHLSTGALGRIHDLARRGIENAVIERLEPDANILAVSLPLSFCVGGRLWNWRTVSSE